MRRVEEDLPVPQIRGGLCSLLPFYVLCLSQMIYTLLLAIPSRLHIFHVPVAGSYYKPGSVRLFFMVRHSIR